MGMFHNEVAATQGIRIRRRPPSGPPLHYVGPFQFRLQNEGNTPRNILEEIIWHKDKEVSQVISSTWCVKCMVFLFLFLFCRISCNATSYYLSVEREKAPLSTDEEP